MEPLLRWPGGKRRLIDKLSAEIGMLDPRGRYLEIFSGGAALFFHMEPERGVLVDVCKPLISFYEGIQREPDAFSDEMERLIALPFGEATYNTIRSEWNGHDFGVRFAARFLYLNKLGFNGLFRLNKKLEFNVAWGKKAKLPEFPTREQVARYSALLRRTQLHAKDYTSILRSTHQYDVIYADPPYWGTYDRYAGDSFGDDNHIQLADGLRKAVERGARIIASNIDCPEVRDLYSWAEIKTVPLLHKISCSNGGRKVVNEVIITASGANTRQMEMFDDCHSQD